jgi:hypothetical protein
MIKPVLLYGSESWSITNTVRNKLQVLVNRCQKSILKIWWPKIISNQELRTQTEEYPIEIRRRKFRWLGHTLSKKEISKKALKWSPEKTRKPGRPKESRIRTAQLEAINQMGYIAKERQKWKQFVTTPCPKRE